MGDYGNPLLKGIEVKNAGGVGIIVGNNAELGNQLSCEPHFLPATAVTYNDSISILQHINSSSNPMAAIKKAETVLHTGPAPSMASFSSRGSKCCRPLHSQGTKITILKNNNCFDLFFYLMGF